MPQIDRLKPAVDVPLRVRLDASAEGIYQAQSQWPDYKYCVNNGKGTLYLLPQAREALVRSGARAGDDVEILKRQDGRASRYEVKILTPGQPQALIARAAAPQPIKTNGNANGAKAVPPSAATAELSKSERMELILEKLLVSSARAHSRASAKLIEEGVHIADGPNWEDVRCTATSLFIHLSEKGVL